MSYYYALAICGARYKLMLDQACGSMWTKEDLDLDEFIDLFRKGVEDQLPLMKLNRWLGYIQGCMITNGLTDVETERNCTRPLFRPLDFGEAE